MMVRNKLDAMAEDASLPSGAIEANTIIIVHLLLPL